VTRRAVSGPEARPGQFSYLRRRFTAAQRAQFRATADAPAGARMIDMALAAIALFGSAALWFAEEIDRNFH
jgi:hypothetical protein